MRYSLISLSFDKLAMTRRCLSAVVEKTAFPKGETELIVVDNGSDDGSVQWLEGDFADCCTKQGLAYRLVRNKTNTGCSTARNQALALARGEYIVFLDNDVEPAGPDWLESLRARMEFAPDIGMVGAKMLYPPPSGIIQCAGVGISKRGHVCFYGRGERDDAPWFQTPREVQALISACLMIRARLYHDYGGFDETYNPVQYEDFDLCYRFRSHGWEAWYEPGARMYHHESTTTNGTPSLPNAAVVIRNGLRFQRAWESLFSREDGPSEEECRWKRICLPG